MRSPLQRLTPDELTQAQGETLATMADLLRQIGYDERLHKLESLQRVATARFR